MSIRLPPLSALRAFTALARLGSINAAAEELSLTQSAISHQIRSIEDYLDVVLFNRDGRKMTLTDAGRVYAYQIRQALDDIGSATDKLSRKPKPNQLVVSVLPSFAQYWLLPRLAGFALQHPDFYLTLSATMAFSNFSDDPIDCAIRFGHGDWPDLHCELLMGDSLLLVASPDFNQGQLPQTVAQVMQAPLLHASESWAVWLSAAGVEQLRPKGKLEFTDSTHLLEAARLGLGIALTRRSIAQTLIDRGELVRVTEIEPTHPSASYYLVWPHRVNQTPALLQLTAWLHVEMSRYQQVYDAKKQ